MRTMKGLYRRLEKGLGLERMLRLKIARLEEKGEAGSVSSYIGAASQAGGIGNGA